MGGDANRDGKLSRAEFDQLLPSLEREGTIDLVLDIPTSIEKLFALEGKFDRQ